jgi:hypothetical protein
MGRRLDRLFEKIRSEKGPFFMARLCLRLDFPVTPGKTPEGETYEREVIEGCKALGYDITMVDVKMWLG